MRRLAILGASGHGKVVADAARLAGWRDLVFFDDAPIQGALLDCRVGGSTRDLIAHRMEFDGAIVAIGDNRTRLGKLRALVDAGVTLATIVHPAAVVSAYAAIGAGTVIAACAVVNPLSRLGQGCVVNTSASIDHDCDLGDAVHVSPGAHVGGGVSIGEATWIGIGASVRHGIRIGSDVIVGGGAMVAADVADGLTVVGVPARRT